MVTPANPAWATNAPRMEFAVKRSLLVTAALGLLTLYCVAHAEGNAKTGQSLYQARCSACHSLDYNGVGPSHRGVVGRAAGSVAGFTYSRALKELHITWNESNLDQWLADPEKFAPGQRMGVNVPDENERKDIIAYLMEAR